MPLVPARCTQCGAALTLDPSQDAAICPFCGTPFVVEKAVNNYTTYNQTTVGTVEHLHVDDGRSVEARLASAENSLAGLNDAEGAFGAFKSVADDKSNEWRAWWGMVRAKTNGLQTIWHEPELGELTAWSRNAQAMAPGDVKGDLARQWEDYLARTAARRDQDYAELGLSPEEIERLRGVPGYDIACREERLSRETSVARSSAASTRNNAEGGRILLVLAAIALAAVLAWNLVRGTLVRAMPLLALLAAVVLALAVYTAYQYRVAKRAQARYDELEKQSEQVGRDLKNRKALEWVDYRWTFNPHAKATWRW